MKMKKLFPLIASLLVAASLSTALVGCDSGSANNTASTAQTQQTGTRFTSKDGAFSFLVPEGFKEETIQQMPAGAYAFLNEKETQVIAVVALNEGNPDPSTLTKEAMQQTMRMMYADAEFFDFQTEPMGDGTLVTYRMESTENGTKSTVLQASYVDADRVVNFTMTGPDNKLDAALLKNTAMSLELPTSTASDVSSEPVASE